MGEHEADQPDARRIRYRIGINVCDIVIDGDDILGDGINVAACLEGLADAGSIAISDDVMRQIRGKVAARFEDAGHHDVKNLSQPLHVWRWSEARRGLSGATMAGSAVPLPS